MQLTEQEQRFDLNAAISFPIGLPGQWHDAEAVSVPDAYLKNWLLDTGSLTERLQSHCRQFSLSLLGQEPIAPALIPARLLQDSQGDWQVREVILHGEGQPWVFAHSLIPDALCKGDLAGLGNKPLGQRIFNDARFSRSAFELTQLSKDDALFDKLGIEATRSLWGRRSVFCFGGGVMMVAEIFLPGSPAYAHMQGN